MKLMTIRNKILLVITAVLMLCSILITSVWYSTSNRMADTYLKDISESTMRDACQAFEYLLTDTSYMAAMVSLNDRNIIRPVKSLRERTIMENGQWNLEYLKNRRIIKEFINDLNGYKYYIVGIGVIVTEDCTFSTSHLVEGQGDVYERIMNLDQDRLKKDIVMLEPFHVEGGKSTLSSDYVVPAVRGITDWNKNIIGYTVLYFDYGVIEDMFSSNLPEGSRFQVVNGSRSMIFSNCGAKLLDADNPVRGYVYNTFEADNVDWTFTMALPSNYYTAGIYRTALFTGGIMVVILLLAGLLSGLVVSRSTREITVLKDSMQEVSAGNLSVSYAVRAEDEIGQMGHTFNHMVVRIRELMRRVGEEERQKRLIEMDFLQAQINPHFISNVLGNVVWMAKLQHADNIVPLIHSLNAMLQNVMHRKDDMIMLADELEYVDNYLTIVEYSGSYDFTVEKHIGEDTEHLYVPRFILQPIVENAIYHGLPTDLSRQGVIKIESVRRQEKLFITVEDNGDGMTKEQIEAVIHTPSGDRKRFNGIGISNVNERIRLFFGEEYGIRYESCPGAYTKAVLVLPVIVHTGEE